MAQLAAGTVAVHVVVVGQIVVAAAAAVVVEAFRWERCTKVFVVAAAVDDDHVAAVVHRALNSSFLHCGSLFLSCSLANWSASIRHPFWFCLQSLARLKLFFLFFCGVSFSIVLIFSL